MTRPTRSFVTTFTCPVTSSTFPVYVSSALMTFVAYSRQSCAAVIATGGAASAGATTSASGCGFGTFASTKIQRPASTTMLRALTTMPATGIPLPWFEPPTSRPIPPSTTPTAPPTRDREPMHGMKLRSSEIDPADQRQDSENARRLGGESDRSSPSHSPPRPARRGPSSSRSRGRRGRSSFPRSSSGYGPAIGTSSVSV